MEWLHPTTKLNKLGMVTFLVALSFFKTQAQNAIKDSIPYISPHTFFVLLETQYPELNINKDWNDVYTIASNNSDLTNQLIEPVRTKRQKRKSARRKKRHEQ